MVASRISVILLQPKEFSISMALEREHFLFGWKLPFFWLLCHLMSRKHWWSSDLVMNPYPQPGSPGARHNPWTLKKGSDIRPLLLSLVQLGFSQYRDDASLLMPHSGCIVDSPCPHKPRFSIILYALFCGFSISCIFSLPPSLCLSLTRTHIQPKADFPKTTCKGLEPGASSCP